MGNELSLGKESQPQQVQQPQQQPQGLNQQYLQQQNFQAQFYDQQNQVQQIPQNQSYLNHFQNQNYSQEVSQQNIQQQQQYKQQPLQQQQQPIPQQQAQLPAIQPQVYGYQQPQQQQYQTQYGQQQVIQQQQNQIPQPVVQQAQVPVYGQQQQIQQQSQIIQGTTTRNVQLNQFQQVQQQTVNYLAHPHLLTEQDLQSGELATLEQIFAERLGTNKLFPEEDLSALLKGVLSALAFLQENGVTHGDIHPSTIYFDHSSGSFKLNASEPNQKQGGGYGLALRRQRFSYLAPELVFQMLQGITEVEPQLFYQADIFSLGMVLLEGASLHSSIECYDQNYAIIQQNLNSLIQFIEEFYSVEFHNLIKAMLDFQARPTPQQLWAAVSVALDNQLISQQQIVQTQQTQPQFAQQPQQIISQQQIYQTQQQSTPQWIQQEVVQSPQQFAQQQVQKAPNHTLSPQAQLVQVPYQLIPKQSQQQILFKSEKDEQVQKVYKDNNYSQNRNTVYLDEQAQNQNQQVYPQQVLTNNLYTQQQQQPVYPAQQFVQQKGVAYTEDEDARLPQFNYGQGQSPIKMIQFVPKQQVPVQQQVQLNQPQIQQQKTVIQDRQTVFIQPKSPIIDKAQQYYVQHAQVSSFQQISDRHPDQEFYTQQENEQEFYQPGVVQNQQVVQQQIPLQNIINKQQLQSQEFHGTNKYALQQNQQSSQNIVYQQQTQPQVVQKIIRVNQIENVDENNYLKQQQQIPKQSFYKVNQQWEQQAETEDNQNISLDERIKQVIARSQAIRDNFQ